MPISRRSSCRSPSFDLVYSSLTLHYIEKLAALFATVHRALAPGGSLSSRRASALHRQPGFALAGRSLAADYLDEGPRTTDWLAKGVVKQHRTLASYLNLLIEAGFTIGHVEEWGPAREEIAAHPEWKIDHRRPAFLLVSARR